MLLSERQLKKLIERMLIENEISDSGSFKFDQDPYTYKIYKVASDSIGIKVIEKNGKPFDGSFEINKENSKKPGVLKILRLITNNLQKFSKWSNIEKTTKLLMNSDLSNSKSLVSDDPKESKKSYTAPSNLNFKKMWSNLSVKDWINSKEDVIGAIRYKQVDYYSWGFVEAPLTEGETSTGLAVSVPFEVYKEMTKTLGSSNIKLIPQDRSVKRIKPSSGNLVLKTQKGMVPVLIKEGTKQIVLGTYEFDSGADVSAEAITQVLDIIGVVPIVGSVADAANVIVQLAFPEPRLFGALLSMIAVIPAIGEAVGAAKIIKNAPKIAKGIKAGEKIVDVLNGVGIKNLRSTIKSKSFVSTLLSHSDSVIKFLEDPKVLEAISKKFPSQAERIRKAIPLFVQYLKDFKSYWSAWKNLPFNKLKKNANEWLALTRRGREALSSGIKEDAVDKALSDSGVYSVFDINEDEGDVFLRIQKLSQKIISLESDSKALDDLQALAIIKYDQILNPIVKSVE